MIRSSHVGSFPLEHSEENVERALVDLYEVGLDVPPYPQLRGFIDIFLSPLVKAGLLVLERGFYVVRNLDIALIRSHHARIEEAELSISIVKRRGLKFVGLRAPITGPFTLASRVYIEPGKTDLSNTLLTRKDLVKELASSYVSKYVEHVVGLGYSVIFLDEPMLGVIVGSRRNLFGYTDDEIVEILESITNRAPGVEVGVHVCGRIHRRILEVLFQIDRVKYLSLEFHDNPSNIEAIDRSLLEKYDKIVSPGIVSSRVPKLESIDEAFSILNKVYSATGGRVDLVSADCGFAGLRGALKTSEEDYQLALAKLRVVVEAVKRLKAISK